MKTPLIRRTIEALDRCGIRTRQQAAAFMPMLKWYLDLGTDDVEFVLAYFPDEIPDQYYHRDDEETGEPLPPDVEGFGLGRHHQRDSSE